MFFDKRFCTHNIPVDDGETVLLEVLDDVEEDKEDKLLVLNPVEDAEDELLGKEKDGKDGLENGLLYVLAEGDEENKLLEGTEIDGGELII